MALEYEFYTNNGFSPIVNAFEYIALFFSHEDYESLMYLSALLGLAIASMVSTSRNDPKDKTMGNWAVMFMAGVGLYTSFVIPKGTIHVYDETLNEYQPVTGVPDGIVLIAGLTNLIEQIAIDIASTSSPVPYEDTAGGIVFDLVKETFDGGQVIGDEYLWQNIKTYYLECGQVAASIGGSGFNYNALKKGTTDLWTTFAAAQSNAVDMVYVSESDPTGTLMTCTDAYNAMNPTLSGITPYNDFEQAVCRSVGFSNTLTARGRCIELIDSILPTVFEETGDRIVYFRSAALAMAMQEAAADINPERAIAQETHRSTMTQSLGMIGYAREYGQTIRAGFLAAALSTLPAVFLFLLTPVRMRALAVSFGFFVFVALWGIIDIGLQVMVEGIAMDAFAEVQENNLAYNAFMLAPTASIKALSVFGASRLISVTLASTITIAVLRLSGASFTGLTNSIAHRAEDIGRDAAETRLNPEELARQTQGRAEAAGELRAMAGTPGGGFGSMASMHEGRWLQNLAQHSAFADTATSSGYTGSEFYELKGAISGGEAAGEITGYARQSSISPAGMAGTARETAAASTERNILDSAAYEQHSANLASHAGISLGTAKELLSGYDQAVATGRISGANGKLEDVFDTSAVEESQRIGTAEGAKDASTRMGLTPGQVSRAESYLNTTYSGGDVQFANQATPDDLNSLSQAGEIKRERLVGEMEGLNTAADFAGRDAGDLSSDTAALDAAGHVLGGHRLQEFADQHGIDTSDILFARGSNMEMAVNDRTLAAFGHEMTEGQREVARPGASMAMTFDPTTGEIGQLDVRSGNSGTFDNTTNIQDGYRVDAQQGTEGGMTLFRYADLNEGGNLQGASQINRLIETASNEGSLASLEDSFAQQTSNYLSNIAGKQVSYLETDSSTGSMEAYAGVKVGGDFSILGLDIGGAEAGTRGSLAETDIDSSQTVNSYDYWNDQLRNVWDETIGNQNFDGDNIERSQAFLSGVNELRERAEQIQEWVKEQDFDDSEAATNGQLESGNTAKGSSEGATSGNDFDWSQYSGFRRF